MNIHQTVPRSDCTSFAKCGKHSLAYCRKYGASECGLCEKCAEVNYTACITDLFSCGGFINRGKVADIKIDKEE